MNAKKTDMPADWVDPDDTPELDDPFFERADEFAGSQLVRRGRPTIASPKRTLTVQYDAEVIEAFKATGKGW